MHVCVLGAGGLGSLIGARLAEIGTEVSLVARPAHVDAITAEGLHVVGISGDRVVRDNLRAFADSADVPGAVDWLVLGVKTRDTTSMLDSATDLVARSGGAFSIQNSTRKDDVLARWFGPERVIGASTTEAGVMVAPGQVHHTATAPVAFYFGERNHADSARVRDLAALFSQAGMSARQTSEIEQVEWEKLLQISAVAGFCGSTIGFYPKGGFGEALSVRTGAEHYVQMVTELLGVYRAMGYEPQDYFAPFATFRQMSERSFDEAVDEAQALGEHLVANGIGGRPSLHEDLVRHKPTELDDCLGAYLAAADRLGIAMPTVRAAYRVIATLESFASETDS